MIPNSRFTSRRRPLPVETCDDQTQADQTPAPVEGSQGTVGSGGNGATDAMESINTGLNHAPFTGHVVQRGHHTCATTSGTCRGCLLGKQLVTWTPIPKPAAAELPGACHWEVANSPRELHFARPYSPNQSTEFSHLPVEIREMIWKLCLPSPDFVALCVETLHYQSSDGLDKIVECTATRANPLDRTLLGINRETNWFFSRVYKPIHIEAWVSDYNEVHLESYEPWEYARFDIRNDTLMISSSGFTDVEKSQGLRFWLPDIENLALHCRGESTVEDDLNFTKGLCSKLKNLTFSLGKFIPRRPTERLHLHNFLPESVDQFNIEEIPSPVPPPTLREIKEVWHSCSMQNVLPPSWIVRQSFLIEINELQDKLVCLRERDPQLWDGIEFRVARPVILQDTSTPMCHERFLQKVWLKPDIPTAEADNSVYYTYVDTRHQLLFLDFELLLPCNPFGKLSDGYTGVHQLAIGEENGGPIVGIWEV
ncbi:hypothetical protein B7494_g8037 [Chlorociboria aeruginascens]|nr:hypothetical protein B7494_g8037 [Chlorociboria aeruginascens]